MFAVFCQTRTENIINSFQSLPVLKAEKQTTLVLAVLRGSKISKQLLVLNDFSPTAIALGSSAIVKVSGQNCCWGIILWAYFFLYFSGP